MLIDINNIDSSVAPALEWISAHEINELIRSRRTRGEAACSRLNGNRSGPWIVPH